MQYIFIICLILASPLSKLKHILFNGCQFNDCVNTKCYEDFDRKFIGYSFPDFFYIHDINLF